MPMFNPCSPCCSKCVLNPAAIAGLPAALYGQNHNGGAFDYGTLTKNVVPLGPTATQLYTGAVSTTTPGSICNPPATTAGTYQILHNPTTCCLTAVYTPAGSGPPVIYPACYAEGPPAPGGGPYKAIVVGGYNGDYFSYPARDLTAQLATAFGPAPQQLAATVVLKDAAADVAAGTFADGATLATFTFPLNYWYSGNVFPTSGNCEGCGGQAAIEWQPTIPQGLGFAALIPAAGTFFDGLTAWVVLTQYDSDPAGLVFGGTVASNCARTGPFPGFSGTATQQFGPDPNVKGFAASTPAVANTMSGYLGYSGGFPLFPYYAGLTQYAHVVKFEVSTSP